MRYIDAVFLGPRGLLCRLAGKNSKNLFGILGLIDMEIRWSLILKKLNRH